MTFSIKDLKTKLEKEYDLVCFEDIGKLLSESVAELYRCLRDNYKEKYLPRERLVFYSGVSVSDSVIQHINHGLQMFDIEPFFVVFYGTGKNQIVADFHHESLSVTDGCIWSGDAPDLSFLCPMPWTSIQVDNQGKMRPCCVFEGHVADIKKTSINDAFHGTAFQKIQRQLLDGQIPSGCKNCFEEERHRQLSNRQRSLQTFQKEFFLDTLKTPTIRNLDIRGGITCNMKCRICDEHNSSLWAAEKTKHSISLIESSDWIKQKDQWEQLIELLPQCINIDFFGGEPLLNKKILELFEKAHQIDVAKNIRLNINTNGSVWNPKFLDCFRWFRSVNVGISLDDIGQRFELQRGSSWDEVQENVKKFLSMNNESFHAYIYATINVQNIYYLPELFEWADLHQADIILSNLNEPSCLSIDRMTVAAKELVINKLSKHSDQRLRDIADRVAKSPGSDGRDFIIFMRDLDQKRKQNFSLAHQEIASAMGYSV